jgi:hypothetical protein
MLASFFFWPSITSSISLILLTASLGMAIFLVIQKHWQTYKQAECTREKMIRNLSLDLLGFLLTLGAAMYAGRLAGTYVGLSTGLWFGLIAGFIGGFLSAWVVRFAWSKLVLSRG